MTRLSPTIDTVRALFARSGNCCAFPGCTSQLVSESNKFIGQICHIEAASSGGERFNVLQSDEERRDYRNLILFCYPHHVETNDLDIYTVGLLHEIKARHEQAFGKKIFQIDESLLHQVSIEMERYWKDIDDLHRNHHLVSDLAIEINANSTFLEISDDVKVLLEDLQKIQNYLIESDPDMKHFEILCLGFTNLLTKLSVSQCQLELRYLEEFIKLHPYDHLLKKRLDQRKSEFAEYAVSAGYAD